MADSFPRRSLSGFPAEGLLLPTIEYDFRGLNDFPTRHGITSSDLRELDHRSAEDSASLVQSWLFFGLLADLAGTLVDRHNILHLSAYQYPPIRRISERGIRRASKAEKLRDVVRIGIDNVERIDRLEIAGAYPMPLILLSIKILLCDLAAMQVVPRSWIEKLEEPYLIPYPPGSSFVSSSAKTLESLMVAKGWCPYQIHRVGSTCDYSMMHYLSNIDRRTSEKTIHEFCSSKYCQAYNSNPDSYLTSHTAMGCQCSFVAAPTKQLQKIIRSGGVPLVSLHEAPHGKLTIRVHASKAKSRYTAISHVWSGGLGNVEGNSLPLCQLQYLDSCVSKLPKDGERGFNYKKNAYIYDLTGKVGISPLGLDNLASSRSRNPKLFWMDTLCIPVDPKSSDLRIRAINKMDAIYAHAREVLVLDTEVQRLSISETHPSELIARLAYSSWMGRSWTLQEGAIGRATYFQCADGAVTLERPRSYFAQQSLLSLVILGIRGVCSIIRHRATKINVSEIAIDQTKGHGRVENFSLKFLLNALHRGRDARVEPNLSMTGLVPEDIQLESFVNVWNELINRSTTKPDDMFAIFANLLDFNAGQIIKLPQNERMRAILWSSDKIPFSLLYNKGLKVHDASHRDRWVPIVPKGSKLTKNPSLKFAEDGRSFRLVDITTKTQPLAAITEVTSLPSYCYLSDEENDKMYFVRAIRSMEDTMNSQSQQAICIMLEPISPARRRRYALNVTPTIRGASLFVKSMNLSSRTTPGSRTQSPVQNSQHRTYEKTVLRTIYDCPVRMWEVKDTSSIPRSAMKTLENQGGPLSCPTIQCTMLTGDYEMHLDTGNRSLPIIYSVRTPRSAMPLQIIPAPTNLMLAVRYLQIQVSWPSICR